MTQTPDRIPAYTSERPASPSPDELRARIPGWGVDADPADRPSVPRLRRIETGARWDFPDRQPDDGARERSIEHRFLTPVFGTAQPLRGLSGRLRSLAYARFSEGRAAHWLILLYADRIDAAESHIRSLATRHPDNPITQTGIRSEITAHGYRSRIGRSRVDLRHSWIDPLIIGSPWLILAAVVTRIIRRRR